MGGIGKPITGLYGVIAEFSDGAARCFPQPSGTRSVLRQLFGEIEDHLKVVEQGVELVVFEGDICMTDATFA